MPRLKLPHIGPLPEFELPSFPLVGNPRDIQQGKKVALEVTMKNVGPIAAVPILVGSIKGPGGKSWQPFRFDFLSIAPGGSEFRETLFDTKGAPLGEYTGEGELTVPNIPSFIPLKRGFSFNLIAPPAIGVGALSVEIIPLTKMIKAGETLVGAWAIRNTGTAPVIFYFASRAEFIETFDSETQHVPFFAWTQQGPWTLQPGMVLPGDTASFAWKIPDVIHEGAVLMVYARAWDREDPSKVYVPEKAFFVASILPTPPPVTPPAPSPEAPPTVKLSEAISVVSQMPNVTPEDISKLKAMSSDGTMVPEITVDLLKAQIGDRPPVTLPSIPPSGTIFPKMPDIGQLPKDYVGVTPIPVPKPWWLPSWDITLAERLVPAPPGTRVIDVYQEKGIGYIKWQVLQAGPRLP